jgi:NADH-quinone oxidoreductase subunit N
VAAFISVGSKTAGFVLFYQIISGLFGLDQRLLELLIGVLAALTMTIGNLVALHQTNMKRFLAYSSIAQAGYLMVGLVNAEPLGVTSVAFYLLVYLVSNIAAFTVINVIARETGREEVQDYVGLSETNPFLAAVMMLAMFSLAGIPPLAGFLGKFYLFAAAAEQGLYWLVLVGAINATVSLFYYLLVIKWMYIVKPATPESLIDKVPLSLSGGVLLVSTSVAMLFIGLTPQFLHWIEESVTLARSGF